MKRSAFDLVPLAFKSFLVASTLFLSADLAFAQQQNSRVERYEGYSEFEQGRTSLRAEGYRVVDVDVCPAPTPPYGSWIAVYRRVPNDPAPSDADRIVQSSNWSQFHAQVNAHVADGWRIDDVDARGPRTPYVALLNRGDGDQQFFSRTWPDLIGQYNTYQASGLRLVDLDFGSLNAQRLYFATMRPGAEAQQLHHDTSWPAFLARWTAMTGGDWRLREIAFAENEFAGVYEQGAGAQAVDVFTDWASLSQRAVELDNNGAANILMEDVECWRDADGVHYAGVWRAPRHATRPRPEANPPVERPPATASDQSQPPLGTLLGVGDAVVVMQPAAAPRFLVRATTLYANDETGPDWPGSDEIYVVFHLQHPDRMADSAGFTARTSVFGDFDTGELRTFRDTQNCLTSALQDDTQGEVSAWHCHPQGDFGPLQFTVRIYEEDSIEDDLIGEMTIHWSREELTGTRLEVGGTSEESIRIGGYTLTWRVERVS